MILRQCGNVGGSQSWSDVAEYEYNALHWRTLKREGTQERRFYYSAAWQLIQEEVHDTTQQATLKRYAQQFWGIRYIDDAAVRHRVDDGGQSSSLYFYITDGQFSTVAMFDEGASLMERVSYFVYGKGTQPTAPPPVLLHVARLRRTAPGDSPRQV